MRMRVHASVGSQDYGYKVAKLQVINKINACQSSKSLTVSSLPTER